MSLKRFSLGDTKNEKKENNSQSNNYTGEIQEYQSGEYMLKISKASLVFKMYAIENGRFLIHFGDTSNSKSQQGYITDKELDLKLNRILSAPISKEGKKQLYDILISGCFYEIVCRVALPLSFITENLDTISKFVTLFLKQWNITLSYKFTFIISSAEKCTAISSNKAYSSDLPPAPEYCLHGHKGDYLIGISNDDTVFITNGETRYRLNIPISIPRLSSGIWDTYGITKSLYWMLLANMDFFIGYGNDICCFNPQFKGNSNDIESFSKFGVLLPDYFKISDSVQHILRKVPWDGNIEKAILASERLKEVPDELFSF